MSQDERTLRLEDAFANLSGLAARSQAVDTKHEARLNTLAGSNPLVIELIRRHDERMGELGVRRAESGEARRASEAGLRALRAETEHKLAALVDAQTRTGGRTREARKICGPRWPSWPRRRNALRSRRHTPTGGPTA